MGVFDATRIYGYYCDTNDTNDLAFRSKEKLDYFLNNNKEGLKYGFF